MSIVRRRRAEQRQLGVLAGVAVAGALVFGVAVGVPADAGSPSGLLDTPLAPATLLAVVR